MKLPKLKCNCCDGIYNSIDVHFLIRRVRARSGLSFPFIHSRVTYLP